MAAEAPVHVTVTIHVNPRDVYDGLNSNDEATLNYICQLVALTHSSDLRERLLQRLGISLNAQGVAQLARYDERHWQDEDYLPEEGAGPNPFDPDALDMSPSGGM